MDVRVVGKKNSWIYVTKLTSIRILNAPNPYLECSEFVQLIALVGYFDAQVKLESV